MGLPLQTIAIATADDEQARILQQFGLKNGYTCVGIARSTLETAGLLQLHKPQILLFDLASYEGIAALGLLSATALILVSPEAAENPVARALELGAEGAILLPTSVSQMRTTLESLWHSFARDNKRQSEIAELKDSLETRKLIDRVKGILMAERKITETEAYRLLQKMSQDKRLSMKEVCRAVEKVRALVGEKNRHKLTP